MNEKSEIVTERENRTISENSILKTEIISLKDEIGNQNDKISSLLQQYKLCEEHLNKYKNDKNSQNEIIRQNENKIESLNPIFNIAATISNSIEYVSETVTSTIKKIINKYLKKNKTSEEEQLEEIIKKEGEDYE